MGNLKFLLIILICLITLFFISIIEVNTAKTIGHKFENVDYVVNKISQDDNSIVIYASNGNNRIVFKSDTLFSVGDTLKLKLK